MHETAPSFSCSFSSFCSTQSHFFVRLRFVYIFLLPSLSHSPTLSLAHLLTLPIILSPSLSLLSSLCAVNCLHTIPLLPVSSCRTQQLLLLLLHILLLCLFLQFLQPHLQVICWPAPATTPASGLNFWRGLFVRQD